MLREWPGRYASYAAMKSGKCRFCRFRHSKGRIRAPPPERRTPIRHGSESCRNAPDRSPALQSRLRCRGQWPDAPLAPPPPPPPPPRGGGGRRGSSSSPPGFLFFFLKTKKRNSQVGEAG